MPQNLNNAEWQHTKKQAKLIEEGKTLLELDFSRKSASLKMGKKKFQISREGFWFPKIKITEKEKIIGLQKQSGLWGTESAFSLDDQTYVAKTSQGISFNITYSQNNNDILTYKLGTVKNKPAISFEIKNFDMPERHLLMLLALGFYSIKNAAVEALANDFIITAVA